VIKLEATAEILAKKIFYRGATFKGRDVFDLAVTLTMAPQEAFRALAATKSAHGVLLSRLDQLATLPPDQLHADVRVTSRGEPHLKNMVEIAKQAVISFGKDGPGESRKGPQMKSQKTPYQGWER
jgi:hypothetical protein